MPSENADELLRYVHDDCNSLSILERVEKRAKRRLQIIEGRKEGRGSLKIYKKNLHLSL